ncbi:MAG: hypothetical protein P8X96_15175 [Desulfobacteraceae bacterium]|jgi:hypothetical protein
MLDRLVQRISRIAYVRSAIEDGAGLECFKQKPTPRIIWGLVIIGISYTIGWPVVFLLGVLSVSWDNPLLVAVGGPLAYGLSHLVFIVGAWLAGAEHAKAFFRWATRVTMLKLTKN